MTTRLASVARLALFESNECVVVCRQMEKWAASNSKSAAVAASARACLDVLRGAAVLIEHNKEALVELLTADGEYMGASGEQDLAMLQGLGRQVSEVLELSSPTVKRASGGPAAPLQSLGAVDEAVKTLEVTDVRGKGHREQGLQDGQPRAHHHHSAAATTVKQSSTAAGDKATVLSSVELLMHIMEYLSGGSGKIWNSMEELGRMALVCRAWRDAAHSEAFWAPLAKELIPRLAKEDYVATQDELRTRAAGSHRQYLMRRGKLTMERRLLNGLRWADDLILQCDIWDNDGFCMFSTESAMEVEDGDDGVDLCAYGSGPSFSVSSRVLYDGHNPPETVGELLEERCLHVRMSVCDRGRAVQ